MSVRTLNGLAVAVGLFILVMASRSPLSAPIDPLAGLEIKRQLLAGSDALLERGVIPPNTPDWVLTDCTALKNGGSAYDRVRLALCEASRRN